MIKEEIEENRREYINWNRKWGEAEKEYSRVRASSTSTKEQIASAERWVYTCKRNFEHYRGKRKY